ncbi:MAG: hypothetical protein AKCLJLPJ_01301 [Fimbriimonadales bacterium]|nr:hypothetical protein [Fimbriimonadales bacterium]MDL1929341.1 glycoside hydrolase family 125 protein [Fimbriimonadia bacterium ATM]NOG92951.1 hypothetical protein [Armatimonadota bacterium]
MPDAGVIAVVCIFGLPMLIGLVSVLTRHQRQMAEILHKSQGQDQALVDEIRALREEVRQLRDRTDAVLFSPGANPQAYDEQRLQTDR